jgi:hypothetical protein
VEFILAVPKTGAIAAGKVLSISATGIAFEPEDPNCMAGMTIGMEFPECSLRVDSSVISLACRLVRTKPTPAFTFTQMDESDRIHLENYIQERHFRERRLH